MAKKTKSKPKKTTTKKRRSTMAKKKTRRKARAFTIPVAIALPCISPIFEGNVHNFIRYGNWEGAFDSLQQRYGFKNMEYSIKTYTGILLGIAVHKIASMLGINRALGQMGMPIFRI